MGDQDHVQPAERCDCLVEYLPMAGDLTDVKDGVIYLSGSPDSEVVTDRGELPGIPAGQKELRSPFGVSLGRLTPDG
jgi:hypothetical protein